MKLLHVINAMDSGGAQSLLFELIGVQYNIYSEVAIAVLYDDGSYYLKSLRERGVKVISLSKNKAVRNPLLIFKLMPIIRKYDVVHVHLFPSNYWTAFSKLLSFAKVPMITTEHSTSNKRRESKILPLIDRFVYEKGYKYVVGCSEDAKISLDSYTPKSKNIAIANGIDTKKFSNAVPYKRKELVGINEDAFCIGMVARFIPSKRQDLLIHALSKLNGDYHLIFVGIGDKLKECECLAQRLGVKDKVHFLGLRSDVPRILQTMDVNALITEYEGLSLSALEGLAVGKPFIGSLAPGMTSIIDGAGELVQNTPESIVAAIEKLQEKHYANLVAKRCQERAKEYDIEEMKNKYDAIYRSILL